MKYKNIDKEKPGTYSITVPPSLVKYARMGGMVNLSEAAREGMEKYAKIGRIAAGVAKPDHEVMRL